jgi:hypothetical protein
MGMSLKPATRVSNNPFQPLVSTNGVPGNHRKDKIEQQAGGSHCMPAYAQMADHKAIMTASRSGKFPCAAAPGS